MPPLTARPPRGAVSCIRLLYGLAGRQAAPVAIVKMIRPAGDGTLRPGALSGVREAKLTVSRTGQRSVPFRRPVSVAVKAYLPWPGHSVRLASVRPYNTEMSSEGP
jgi:hypothetical protein